MQIILPHTMSCGFQMCGKMASHMYDRWLKYFKYKVLYQHFSYPYLISPIVLQVAEDGMKSGSHILQHHIYWLSILRVWIVVSVYEWIIHLNGLFLSLLVLCRMVTTTSTARTLTVHQKRIRRWVSFTLCNLLMFITFDVIFLCSPVILLTYSA